MAAHLTPGLYYEIADTGRTRLPAIRTDVAAFVGVAARGPLNRSTPIYSWAQFQARFGNFVPGPFLAYSVKAFFENGGVECHVVRVAAGPISTESDLSKVQPADRLSSFVDSTQGFVPGAVVSLSQAPDTGQDFLLADVDTVALTLKWAELLSPLFDITKTIEFTTGAAAASITLLDANAKPTLRVSAESSGAWGNQLAITVGKSSHAATRARAGVTQTAGGTFVESLAGFTAHALVKVFQDQSPSPAVIAYHTIAVVDSAAHRIVWDAPLEAAFNLADPIHFESVEFTISVAERGVLREVFDGLSLVEQHPRYAARAISDRTSKYIGVEDLHSASSLEEKLPIPAAPNLTNGTVYLRAGRDGIAALQTGDFTGNPASQERLGLRSLELDRGVSAVAIPDILMQPAPPTAFAPIPAPSNPCLPCGTPPPTALPLPPAVMERIPAFSLDDVERVQQALILHCESMRYRIAIIDPPLFSAAKESVDFAEVQTWRQRFDSKYAGLYFPWLVVLDPLQVRQDVVRRVPPSGHVAGIYARTDLTKGVHQAPANQVVNWALDLVIPIDAARQGVLNPVGINCFRNFRGRGLLLYGARTISSETLWAYVNVRRLLMMIEESIEDAVQWAVFEPNNLALRQMLTRTITGFLETLWERGALKGSTAGEAFFVKCDDDNNPPSLAGTGQLIVDVGVAPSIPAEFVIFRIGRTDETLGVTE